MHGAAAQPLVEAPSIENHIPPSSPCLQMNGSPVSKDLEERAGSLLNQLASDELLGDFVVDFLDEVGSNDPYFQSKGNTDQ
jgi:hypothetical protein